MPSSDRFIEIWKLASVFSLIKLLCGSKQFANAVMNASSLSAGSVCRWVDSRLLYRLCSRSRISDSSWSSRVSWSTSYLMRFRQRSFISAGVAAQPISSGSETMDSLTEKSKSLSISRWA